MYTDYVKTIKNTPIWTLPSDEPRLKIEIKNA